MDGRRGGAGGFAKCSSGWSAQVGADDAQCHVGVAVGGVFRAPAVDIAVPPGDVDAQ